MKARWTLGGAEGALHHCATCLELEGQIHPLGEWYALELYPQSPKLICFLHCHCHFEPVPDETPDTLWPDLATDQRPNPQKEHPMTEHSARLQLATTAASGRFEILAITAGAGNGWTFPAEVLQASLALGDKVVCYIDPALPSPPGRGAGGEASAQAPTG